MIMSGICNNVFTIEIKLKQNSFPPHVNNLFIMFSIYYLFGILNQTEVLLNG